MTAKRTIFLCGLLWLGCGQDQRDRDTEPTDAATPTAPPEGAAPAVQQPATGAANATAAIELGRLLFFDPVLSGDRDISCSTCHHPSFAWGDGRRLSVGTGGTGLGPARVASSTSPHVTTRNSMTVLNVGLNGVTARDRGPDPATAPMFWDHRVRSLEAQAAQPILALDEMRGTPFTEATIFPEVEGRLRAVPDYVTRFSAAFGAQPISRDTITRAIASFERTSSTATRPSTATRSPRSNSVDETSSRATAASGATTVRCSRTTACTGSVCRGSPPACARRHCEA